MFVHVVLFWLKDDAPEDAAEAMKRDMEDSLSQIPGATHVWGGFPAMTPREVVDNSYSVGLCVVLPDSAAHDVYQQHPLHHQFIQKHKPHWGRIQVYDFA